MSQFFRVKVNSQVWLVKASDSRSALNKGLFMHWHDGPKIEIGGFANLDIELIRLSKKEYDTVLAQLKANSVEEGSQ